MSWIKNESDIGPEAILSFGPWLCVEWYWSSPLWCLERQSWHVTPMHQNLQWRNVWLAGGCLLVLQTGQTEILWQGQHLSLGLVYIVLISVVNYIGKSRGGGGGAHALPKITQRCDKVWKRRENLMNLILYLGPKIFQNSSESIWNFNIFWGRTPTPPAAGFRLTPYFTPLQPNFLGSALQWLGVVIILNAIWSNILEEILVIDCISTKFLDVWCDIRVKTPAINSYIFCIFSY